MACKFVDRRRLVESARHRKLEVGWLDPMTEVEKVSNDIASAFSSLARNNCSEPVEVIETKLAHSTDIVTSGNTLSCDDAEAIALTIMASNGIRVQPEFSSCTVVEEPLPEFGGEAVYQPPEATSRDIMLPPAPLEDVGDDSGFPIWAIVLIALLALLMCCCCWIFGILCWRRWKKDKWIKEKNILYEGDEEIIKNRDTPYYVDSGECSSANAVAGAGAVAFSFAVLQKDKGLEDQRVSKSLALASVTTPDGKTYGDAALGETMLSSSIDTSIAFPLPPTGIQQDESWSDDGEASKIIAGWRGSGSSSATHVSMMSTRGLHDPNLSDEEDDLTSTQSYSTEHGRVPYNPLVDLRTDSNGDNGPKISRSYSGVNVYALDSPRWAPILHKSFSLLRATPINSRLNPRHSTKEPARDSVNRPSSSQPSTSAMRKSLQADLSLYNPTPPSSMGKLLKDDKSLNPARTIISPYSRTASPPMHGSLMHSVSLRARARTSVQLTRAILSASSSELPLKNGGSSSSNIDSGDRSSAWGQAPCLTRMNSSIFSISEADNNAVQGTPALVPVSGILMRNSIDSRPSTQPKSIMKTNSSIWDESAVRKTASWATVIEHRRTHTGYKEHSSFMPDKGRSSAPQVNVDRKSSLNLPPRLLKNMRSVRYQQRKSPQNSVPDKEVKESQVGWESPQEGGANKALLRSDSRKFIRPHDRFVLEDPNEVETIVMESPFPVFKRHG
eukprot:gene17410-23710_t